MTILRHALIVVGCVMLVSCGSTQKIHQSSPTPNPTYKVGNPYKVAGKVYRPEVNPNYDQTGLASWYGPQFHGRKTANGDVFNMNDLTAAHTTLPMPSYVRVTNTSNGRWLILKVNDRGPFVGNRLIDVSRRAAQLLGFEKKGVTQVRVQAVDGPRGELPRGTMAVRQPEPKEPIRQTTQEVVIETAASSQVEQADIQPLSLNKKIYIQVGAYADQNNAKKTHDHIGHISETKIDKVDINGQKLYRVRVGPHMTLEMAEVILGRILSLGHNTARIIMD